MTLSDLDNMEVYRSDQASWDVDAGTDMTSATVYFAVYATFPLGAIDDDTTALIYKDTADGIAFTDDTEGEFTITIDTADTADWEFSGEKIHYVYGIEYQPYGETYRTSIGRGVFVVYKDVVRT